MRLEFEQDNQLKDILVKIRYAEKNRMLVRLVRAVRSCEESISAYDEGKEVPLAVPDVYYFESVDKKTFAYVQKEVYRVDERLYQLQEKYARYGFVQISKSCVLNINMLRSVRTLMNSRMEAVLTNGERIGISRRFIPDLKKAVKER